MNWKKKFLGDPKELTVENLRGGMFIMLMFVVLFLLGFILFSILDFYETGIVEIPVYFAGLDKSFNHTIETEYGNYLAGMGILEFKAKSVWQILVLRKFGDLDLFKLIYFIIVMIPFRLSVNKLSDKLSFHKSLFNSVQFLGIFTFICFGFLERYYLDYLENMVEMATNHMYDFHPNRDSLSLAIMCGLVTVMAFFLKKGEELQQEKDLTI